MNMKLPRLFGGSKSRKNLIIETIVEERTKMLSDSSSFSTTEAYKATRTNLMFLHLDDKCQKIAFTSSYPSEGKSINCINMAITLAQNDKKVLIIDCDMRKPKVRYMFGETSSPGLSEYLAGIEDSPTIRETKYKNLWIMTAGKTPPNPAELLSSPAMGTLLAGLEDQFDYILLDTPPVNVVTDAAVLSKRIHGFIMVVRANQTRKEELRDAVLCLEQLEANIVGFILNDIDSKSAGYGKYGKYGKYAKYKYSRYG